MNEPTVEQFQEAFEKTAKLTGYTALDFTKNEKGEYVSHATQLVWVGARMGVVTLGMMGGIVP